MRNASAPEFSQGALTVLRKRSLAHDPVRSISGGQLVSLAMANAQDDRGGLAFAKPPLERKSPSRNVCFMRG